MACAGGRPKQNPGRWAGDAKKERSMSGQSVLVETCYERTTYFPFWLEVMHSFSQAPGAIRVQK